MRPIPKINRDMLHRFEGFSATAKNDEGLPSIGYGHRMPDPDDPLRNATITPEQAEVLALADLAKIGVILENLLTPQIVAAMSDHQWAAVLDFAFNIGSGHFAGSTMMALIKSLKFDDVAAQFGRWVYAKDAAGDEVEQPGLVARRSAEAALWSGLYHLGAA